MPQLATVALCDHNRIDLVSQYGTRDEIISFTFPIIDNILK